jgi:hypothetical protein
LVIETQKDYTYHQEIKTAKKNAQNVVKSSTGQKIVFVLLVEIGKVERIIETKQ